MRGVLRLLGREVRHHRALTSRSCFESSPPPKLLSAWNGQAGAPVQEGRLQVAQICEARATSSRRGSAILRWGSASMTATHASAVVISASNHLAGEVRPADAPEEGRLARDLGEACRQGYVFAG